MSRYADLESHADVGLGAEEPGMARFTRPCERIAHHDAVVAATQEILDAAADRLWRRMQDTPQDHPLYEMYRDLAFAAKDRADQFARQMNVPSTSTAKHQVEGSTTNNQKGSK